jgi:hypothetical protein
MSQLFKKLIEHKAKEPISTHTLDVVVPTTILEFDLSKIIDNTNLLNIIEEHKKEFPVSMQDYDERTNVKTWHSDWKTHLINQKFQPFIDSIKSCLKNHYPHLELSDFWFNIYEDTGSAKRHNHGPLQLSCVYFVECDEESSPLIIDNNSLDRKTIVIQPKVGKLVAFPSFVYHSVKNNGTKNNNKRISIAFNFYIAYNENVTDEYIEERKKLCRGTDV